MRERSSTRCLTSAPSTIPDTHTSAVATGDELVVVLDDARSLDITYGKDNASKDAVTNTGEVALDSETYRVSDDVTITLTDADLNTDSGTTEIYPIASDSGTVPPRLVEIEIGDLDCASEIGAVSLRETADDSGVFEATFDGSDDMRQQRRIDYRRKHHGHLRGRQGRRRQRQRVVRLGHNPREHRLCQP